MTQPTQWLTWADNQHHRSGIWEVQLPDGQRGLALVPDITTLGDYLTHKFGPDVAKQCRFRYREAFNPPANHE